MSLLEKRRKRDFWKKENSKPKGLAKTIASVYISILAIGFSAFLFLGTLYEIFLAGGWKGIFVVLGSALFLISLLWATFTIIDEDN